jgi:hypothetical protein
VRNKAQREPGRKEDGEGSVSEEQVEEEEDGQKGRMGRECVVRQVGKNGEGECMRNRVVMCIW